MISQSTAVTTVNEIMRRVCAWWAEFARAPPCTRGWCQPPPTTPSQGLVRVHERALEGRQLHPPSALDPNVHEHAVRNPYRSRTSPTTSASLYVMSAASSARQGPPSHDCGCPVRFEIAEVDCWLESTQVSLDVETTSKFAAQRPRSSRLGHQRADGLRGARPNAGRCASAGGGDSGGPPMDDPTRLRTTDRTGLADVTDFSGIAAVVRLDARSEVSDPEPAFPV